MTGRAAHSALLSLAFAVWMPAAVAAQGAGEVAAATTASLPDSPGVEVARSHCISCHGPTLIVGQRLSRAGWDREVAKMERWSRAVPSPDRDRLVDYLAAQFGVTRAPVSTAAAGERGRAVHDRACRTCHDDGFARAQRLTAAGWRRTVAKMVGWGAQVPPDDVDSLVAFLQTAPPPAR